MLQITFLGNISFIKDGKDVSHGISNKMAAIVALLMLQKSKSMGRDELMEYLWPESSEEAAKYNLRYNLWTLKKVIGKDGEEDLITVTKDCCKVNDKYAFFCDIDTAYKDVEAINKEEAEEYYSVINGDFFKGCYFTGCNDFNEIIILQRNFYEQLKFKVISHLARLYFQAGEYNKVIEAIKVSMGIDPYNESNAIILIEAYNMLKDRSNAIKAYYSIKNRLACDLNIEPSEELKNKLLEIEGIKKGNNREVLKISPVPIKHLDFYFLGAIIESLVKVGVDVTQYMTKSEEKELSSICIELERHNVSVLPIRLTQAFISFISKLSKDYNVEILWEDKEEIDEASKTTLKRCGKF